MDRSIHELVGISLGKHGRPQTQVGIPSEARSGPRKHMNSLVLEGSGRLASRRPLGHDDGPPGRDHAVADLQHQSSSMRDGQLLHLLPRVKFRHTSYITVAAPPVCKNVNIYIRSNL